MLNFLDILVRLLLIVASILLFAPQANRIKDNGHCAGISIFYLLYNSIVATYDFTLMLFAVLEGEDNILFHQPPDARDWLNLAQFTVAWLGQRVLLYLVLTLPPHRPAQRRTAIVVYLSLIAVSLVPVVGGALIPPEEREWYSIILEGTLLFLLGPLAQLLGFAALGVQASETRSRGPADALSIRGLVVQAVVFFLVGISFVFRLKLPSDDLDEHFIVNLRDWYWRLGWATINNLVFAFAQGILAWIAVRQGDHDRSERGPLLA